MAAPVRIPWTRLTHPVDVEPVRDQSGWILATSPRQHRDVRPLAERRDMPALALLGERGYGKSDVLRCEYEQLTSGGAEAVFIDLATEPADRAKEKVLKALGACSDGVRHILVDGLDDAPLAADFDRFLGSVLEDLDQEQRGNIRLRVSCRTSRWPALLDDAGARLWPRGYARVHVAGLTRQDAAVAARHHGQEPEGILDRLERERLVVPLGTWPVTLIPLLKAAAAGLPLPRTVSEAYAEACRQLCMEKPAATLNDPRGEATQASGLIAVARRAAAVLQFCGREAISDAGGEPATTTLEELAGGTEPLEISGEVDCNLGALRALTESGLLAPVRGPGFWAFSHRSFQEYQAAQYLRLHNTDYAVCRSLVMVGDGPTRRPASAHREVAAWMATFDDRMFEELVTCDPQTLLLGDLAARTPGDRLRVFDAILAAIRDGMAPGYDPTLLRQLDTDLLAARLQKLLVPNLPEDQLWFALWCARSCPHRELTDALLGVGEATSLPKRVRTMALGALLPEFLEAGHAARLRALLADDDPDVAAHAITLLYPRHLTMIDLLAHLPRPEPRYLGQAAGLLLQLPLMLGDGDLLDAARWCAATLAGADPGALDASEHSKAAVRLTARIVASAVLPADGNSPLARALAQAIVTNANFETWHTRMLPTEELDEALEKHVHNRRAIARAAVEAASSRRRIRALCMGGQGTGLFRGERDSGFWAAQYPTLSRIDRALLRWPLMPIPQDPGEWAAAFELSESYPALKRKIEHWYRCPVDHPARTDHHDRVEHRSAREAERSAHRPDEAELRKALTAVHVPHADLRAAWRNVVHHLYRTQDGERVFVPEHLDLTAAPSYPAGDSGLAADIARAAELVITGAPLIEPKAVSPNGIAAFYETPEILGLSLLASNPPALPADRWAGLAITLTCMQVEGPGDRALRDELLLMCAARSHGRFGGSLQAVLDRLGQPWLDNVISLLPPLPASDCTELLAWAKAPRRPVDLAAPVLRYLAQQRHLDAVAVLRTWTDVAPSRLRGALTSTAVTRWLHGAEVLISTGQAAVWPGVLRKLEMVPALAAPLLKKLSHAAVFGTWLDSLHDVPSAELARLYELMTDRGLGAMPPSAPSLSVHNAHELRALHRLLLETIVMRPSRDAIDVLADVAARHPQDLALAEWLHAARQDALDRSCTPVTSVSDLMKVAAIPANRLADNELQLRDIVLESLERLQEQLKAANGWATALWNQDRKRVTDERGKHTTRTHWWPTWENDFSDFVAAFLRYDLSGRKVIVNREVELVRPGLEGSRTDIQIEAHPASGPRDPNPLTVVIESKGCWNNDLDTGLRQQLVAKYLEKPGKRAGIYLIAYFDDPVWKRDKRESRKHAGHTIDAILQRQLALAAEAVNASPGLAVTAMVLDCRLPGDRAKEQSNQ